MSGITCSMWGPSLWLVGFSLVVVCRPSCPAACGILVPWLGTKPVSPALEGRLPITGLLGKFLCFLLYLVFLSLSLRVLFFCLSALIRTLGFSSVQFSHSVVSDSLWPHESQHTRPPCPSPSPGVHSNSRSSSWWCHSAISSSVIPFSSCPQSLPASESFRMSQLLAWGGQNTVVSALAPVLPKNSQDWSLLG